MKSELIATVKQEFGATPETFECRVFLLREDLDLTGRIVEHKRGEEVLGAFVLESITKDFFKMRRTSGSDTPIVTDSFYVQLEDAQVATAQEAPRGPVVSGYMFSGKNWKLASVKKWKNGQVESPSKSKPVGEINLFGHQCEVHKTDSGFVAIPIAIPTTES
jgi:hypothetical protein